MKSVARPAAVDRSCGLRYRIVPADPKGHYFDVTCDVTDPDPAGQRLSLPAWIPGSYMIREFARNIVSISAENRRQPLSLVKLDKHTWRAAPCTGVLRLRYRVYAWDASVRAAHLDETHAFFNGTSVFLKVEGREHEPHEVDVQPPPGKPYRDWRVATTLPEHGASRDGFGIYRAADYDALIDHPVEMGRFRREHFTAAGVPHEIAYTGVVPNLDAARINADIAVLCAAQIRFFGTSSSTSEAPFDRYLFLTAVAGEGYGGLEHRASTALLCTRDGLPTVGPEADTTTRNGAYLTFLGLVSHEYFHSWNVKRIKPAVFAPYDLARENYTSLLWIFEGFTSYYDDLFLVRTGLATEAQYREMLAKTIDDVLAGSGRHLQSIADSSFDAWVKYYRQDENTPNAVVSYYKKGSLVALCLDLSIRLKSRGKASLDDVMRLMWQRFGRDFYDGPGGNGVEESAFPGLVLEATGVDVADDVRRWAHGTDELPIATLLESFGLQLRSEPRQPAPSLGVRTAVNGAELRLASVASGGPAHHAGLSAGDVLVAIDGLRVGPGRLDPLLARYRSGDIVEVTAFRGDVLQTRSLTLQPGPQKAIIEVVGGQKRVSALRDRWLAGPDRRVG